MPMPRLWDTGRGPCGQANSPRLREPAGPSVFHGPKLGVEFTSGWQAKTRGRKGHPAPFSHDLGTEFAVQLRPVQSTRVAGNHPLRFVR